ncbi:MAG: cyclic nucleotide-binding and patatin-like phospholipase domain-containing protein [Steroidobacteraceae bacterium]
MALEEEPSGAPQELRRAIDCLESSADLEAVPRTALEALAAGAVHFSLPAGDTLFESGAMPEGVYLLASGRLGVRGTEGPGFKAEIERGELVGEAGWLLREPHSATVTALRDSELLLLPHALLEDAAARSSELALAMARLCARRLRRSNAAYHNARRARVFALVPNSEDIDTIDFAARLTEELRRTGRTELVWDVRAEAHTASWFGRLEEQNDYIVYAAGPGEVGWLRQCCRQADLILTLAHAGGEPRPWPAAVCAAAGRGTRVELALLHEGAFVAGAASRWLKTLPVAQHHHIAGPADLGRAARLITRRGVGLVLSGGGARGFAHLGVVRALREARVPIDFVGGSSIGAIIAAGIAMGWSDEEMRLRYRRSFVDSNPVNDYTFPLIALTRGRKVSRLLEREYGGTLIEDLRTPFFCLSADLNAARAVEHRDGVVWRALRAAVAIPGMLPPVFRGDDVLVDGAAINNLPIDLMHARTPGLVIGCDVGADHRTAPHVMADGPPLWRLFSRGGRRMNIFQILMRAGMVNSVSSAAAQRSLADVLLKPPLTNIDLLEWHAFDRAIEAGYEHTVRALKEFANLPRLAPAPGEPTPTSLSTELERRLTARALAG